MVRTITDSHGTEFISLIDSWLAWREITDDFNMVMERTGKDISLVSGDEFIKSLGHYSCPFCHGERSFIDKTRGKIFCICRILDWQLEVADRIDPCRSPLSNVSLDDLETIETSMETAVKTAREFVKYPSKWITYFGRSGVGKTHILMSIALAYRPIALYISAEDFEEHLYQATAGGAINEYMSIVKQVPVLLLDDWGIEHGAPYVKAKLRALINYRYNLWREFPTVVASNFSPKTAQSEDPRIGSRIQDKDRVDVVVIKAPNYRMLPRI